MLEKTDYVKGSEGSRIELMPVSGHISKQKERTLVKTLYEAFMDEFWHSMLQAYSNALGYTLCAPESKGVEYENSTFKGALYMTFCKGKRLSQIPNTKDHVLFDGKEVRVGSVIAFHCGLIDRILECEGLVHGDRALRHLLFYSENDQYSLSVIDWEKSRQATPEEIKAESEKFQKALFDRFGHPQAQKLFADGRQLVTPLNLADQVYAQTLESLRNKFNNATITPNIKDGTLSVEVQ
jgi:hypothetical protein